MPELRLLLLGRRVKRRVLLHLNDEPYFGRVAEVSDSQCAHLLNERLTSQLHLVLSLLNKLLDLIRLQLHDAANA